MRLQQFGADFVSDFGDVAVCGELGDSENQFARQRVAVGVQPARGQREQQVAVTHAARVEDFPAFDGADDEAREIVIAGRVDIGHFRGFAADQRTAGLFRRAAQTLDHLLEHARVELAHGDIVEEKKRLGALRENVVDAVIQDVGADGGVDAGRAGDFQLGAHAVAAGDQHGIAPAFLIQLKERAESANGREHAAPKSFPGHGGDPPLGFVRNRDVDAGIGVAHVRSSFSERGRADREFYSVWNRRFQRTRLGWMQHAGVCFKSLRRRNPGPRLRRDPARQWTYR